MQRKKTIGAACGLAALLATGCFQDMSPPAVPTPSRRLYVNDSAANDSLRGALVRDGVYFVLRPGQSYSLRVSTQATGDRMVFYVYSGNFLKSLGTREAVAGGGGETFSLASTQATWAYYTVQLVPADGESAIG